MLSNSYYISRMGTVCEQPQLILVFDLGAPIDCFCLFAFASALFLNWEAIHHTKPPLYGLILLF